MYPPFQRGEGIPHVPFRIAYHERLLIILVPPKPLLSFLVNPGEEPNGRQNGQFPGKVLNMAELAMLGPPGVLRALTRQKAP